MDSATSLLAILGAILPGLLSCIGGLTQAWKSGDAVQGKRFLSSLIIFVIVGIGMYFGVQPADIEAALGTAAIANIISIGVNKIVDAYWTKPPPEAPAIPPSP